MKITIDTKHLSARVHSIIGEIPDERGRSAHMTSAMNRMAEVIEDLRAQEQRREGVLRDHQVTIAQLEREVRREREARATIDEALGQTVCERDRALTDLDSARAGHERKLWERSIALDHAAEEKKELLLRVKEAEEGLADARTELRKAHERIARFEAELVVMTSEKAHMRAEWRRAVMEEEHIRTEYAKLKEKVFSTSST